MSILQYIAAKEFRAIPKGLLVDLGRTPLKARSRFTYSEIPSSAPFKWNHQEHFLLVMNLKGRGVVRYPRHSEPILEGEILLAPPHTPVFLAPAKDWSLRAFTMQSALVNPPSVHQNPWRRINLPCRVPHPGSEDLFNELETLRISLGDPYEGKYSTEYRLLAQSLFQELLSIFLTVGFSNGLLKEQIVIPARLQRAFDHLETRLKFPDLTVDELADKAGVSHKQLIEDFKVHFGETPYQLIQKKRIQLAKHLLNGNPDITLEHIATRCGYRNRSSLHRQFKKHLGISPGEFRSPYSSRDS